MKCIEGLFPNVSSNDLHRPSSGYIDCLIGYNYAAFHPSKLHATEHLLLLENRFGRIIGGRHESIKEQTMCLVQNASVFKLAAKVDDFFKVETFGVESNPRCGGCKCGTCHPGGKEMTIQEEQEFHIIKKNLKHDPQQNKWTAGYPWIKDAHNLPNNVSFALSRLISTEKRLAKDPNMAALYSQEIKNMVNRGAARKLTNTEARDYKGPIFYIAHHAIIKPTSSSTPCRIVFNSSAKFKGHALNDYYAKGPDSLNNLLGILLRFREEQVALVGDISKMFHSIQIPELDQMTHRFLWRDLETHRYPDTYVMTALNMGDKPSGSIAISALKKTAETKRKDNPDSSKVIIDNSYMDNIVDSVASYDLATSTTKEVDTILALGGFRVKRWFISGQSSQAYSEDALSICETTSDKGEDSQRVLGMKWEAKSDSIIFESVYNKNELTNIQQNISISRQIPHTHQIIKHIILSQVNSLYDPLGLLSPFTVKAKILLRKL